MDRQITIKDAVVIEGEGDESSRWTRLVIHEGRKSSDHRCIFLVSCVRPKPFRLKRGEPQIDNLGAMDASRNIHSCITKSPSPFHFQLKAA
jgi:hypothetical protein